MVGSIRQRSANSWELRVYCGVDPDTKRPRYATRTVHGSKRTARETLAALVDEVDHARTHAGSVSELLDGWFDAASPMWAASTRRQTRSVIDRHVRPRLGAVPLARLTTAMIDDFYANLRRPGGHELSPGTVRRIHVVVHRALAQAQRWGWIYTNPASLAQPPRYEPTEIRPPAPAQIGTLLAFVRARDPDFHLYLHLAACTGARRSQLLALRWRGVDMDAGALCFQRAFVDAAGGPVLQPTKNRRSDRVALDAESLALLAAHVRRCDKAVADSFVFCSDAVGCAPWRPNWVTKQFIRYRRAANAGTFRLHDLRHFMATAMLARGVPVVTVSERLGHARASTTLNVYAHSIPGADHDAAKLVAALICHHADGIG